MVYIEKENIKEWISTLKEAAKASKNKKLLMEIIENLEIPARERKGVNLYKLNKHTDENDNVIVPRKVLSLGKLDHKINIAALEYSTSAEKALREKGCNILSIKDMIGKDKIHLII
ncbi:MAG: 50S ribosomal protein L18e [Candidatus Micrarchaeia archaeon]